MDRAFFGGKMNILDFIGIPFDSICYNWEEIQENLDMQIHSHLKQYCTKAVGSNIKEAITLDSDFFVKTGDQKNDTWLLKEDITKNPIQLTLYLPQNKESIEDFLENAFEEWTGDNDFGQRAMIGELFTNIGEILILLNNKTGDIEWIDCGYGYFDVFEENPHGILAKSIQDFLNNIKLRIQQ